MKNVGLRKEEENKEFITGMGLSEEVEDKNRDKGEANMFNYQAAIPIKARTASTVSASLWMPEI